MKTAHPVLARHSLVLLSTGLLAAMIAQAHVTLPPGGAPAGSAYAAAFRVGHACKDATSTTALKVRLPEGFTPFEAVPRAGWTVTQAGSEVSWTASSPQAALPTKEATTFVVNGKLTDKPGTLWFKVL